MISLTLEQQQMVKIIDDHASKFSFSEVGNEQLLQTCYDYMAAFKQVIDSTSKPQLDYICQQYEGFYRFAKLMEMLAQGIADGVIEVPKDH
ncbi:MAG: arylsulfatase regulator [Gammaproteobacteria bacterium]|nr:arylsulfatase regulator [Gammaproteobacteria bacterium]MBT7209464.1 arylsulfatase regulator [Gammaproteobacteria bacterium]